MLQQNYFVLCLENPAEFGKGFFRFGNRAKDKRGQSGVKGICRKGKFLGIRLNQFDRLEGRNDA